MKNQIKKISTLTLTMFVVVMLVSGCSKTTVELSPAEQIIGKWKYTTATNISLDKADFADLQDYYKDGCEGIIFEFKAGDTLTETVDGQSEDYAYSMSGNKIVIEDNIFTGEHTVSFTGNIMNLRDEEIRLFFIKQ